VSVPAVEPKAARALHVAAVDGDDRPPAPLVLRGVVQRFGSVSVLEELDLVLAPGEVALVEGRNGVGKTTLLRVAAGLITPDRGTARAWGLHPDRDRRAYARRLGLLSAGDRGLYARLTVRQNLEFAAGLALLGRRERARAVDRAVTRFGLEDLAPRRVDRISMGQRQRARLAMTLLHDPDVILLDEPAASLDDEGILRLGEAVGEVVARGGAALWCTPTGAATPLAADRRYVLRKGALEAS
jgi:ABC-type multidrug transport system ATPase subunit